MRFCSHLQHAVQLRIKNEYSLPCPNAFFRLRQGMKKLAGVEEGDCLLNASDEFPAGSSVCDWAALACAVGGAEDSYTAYLHALEAYVKNKLGEDSSLGRATDYPPNRSYGARTWR